MALRAIANPPSPMCEPSGILRTTSATPLTLSCTFLRVSPSEACAFERLLQLPYSNDRSGRCQQKELLESQATAKHDLKSTHGAQSRLARSQDEHRVREESAETFQRSCGPKRRDIPLCLSRQWCIPSPRIMNPTPWEQLGFQQTFAQHHNRLSPLADTHILGALLGIEIQSNATHLLGHPQQNVPCQNSHGA